MSRTGTMTSPRRALLASRAKRPTRWIRPARCGRASRALASLLSVALVWLSVVPGIAAAQEVATGDPPEIEHQPPEGMVAGEAVRLEARVASEGGGAFVTLHHRTLGETRYLSAPMRRVGGDLYAFERSTEEGDATGIEYWIDASGANGASARAGSPEAPFLVEVAAAREPPSDTTPPLIEHQPSASVTSNEPQRIEARVTDAGGVDRVVLFHRAAPDGEFERTVMEAAGDDRYVATLAPPARATTIEYFIEARDEAGTRAMRGSRFAPLERTLGPGGDDTDASVGGAEVLTDTDESGGESAPSRTLWYVVGGAVLLGLVAAAAGGGGSGGGGPPPPPGDCCNVTFTVDAPQ